MNPETLRGIVVFVEVARLKSFSRAGKALDMPTSTVSRRVSALESEIGLKLLKRNTQRVELTEEGEAYFLRCQRIVEEAESAHEELLGTRLQPRGHLRVAMTADFALRIVAALPDFCHRHPDLVIEFDLTSRVVDPTHESCDVAIYIGEPPDSWLTAIKLAEVQLHLFGAPSYLREHGAPREVADLQTHACIRLYGSESRWKLYKGVECSEAALSGPLILNSISLIRRLAVDSAGIVLLPESLCREELQAGTLVRVLEGWTAAPVPIYALTATRMMPARTRAFVNFLKSQLL